jgi:uncharacterized protein YjbJ (UPF0337 family)
LQLRTELQLSTRRFPRGNLPREPERHLTTKETTMSADSDKAKGHVKQAVGDLTDDKDLEREGKVDELAGKAKETVDKAKDALTDDDS